MSNTEIKHNFPDLKNKAIAWSLAWRDYHMQMMENEIARDHTRTAQDHFDSAARAENCAAWLKGSSRKQFANWLHTYESTGFAY